MGDSVQEMLFVVGRVRQNGGGGLGRISGRRGFVVLKTTWPERWYSFAVPRLKVSRPRWLVGLAAGRSPILVLTGPDVDRNRRAGTKLHHHKVRIVRARCPAARK